MFAHLSQPSSITSHTITTLSPMGKLLHEITEKEAAFISSQPVFFVATAPLSKAHRVNVSPKAPGTSVVVVGSHEVVYADLSGSGNETASHVMENGRMTLMFCNLEKGLPKILRLHGHASITLADEVSEDLIRRFPQDIVSSPGFRCVYRLKVGRISSSCGYSLPIMKFERQRQTLNEHFAKMTREEAKMYCIYKNSFSIDGLQGLSHLLKDASTISLLYKDGYVFGEIPNANDVLIRKMRRYWTIVMRYLQRSLRDPLVLNVVVLMTGIFIGRYCF